MYALVVPLLIIECTLFFMLITAAVELCCVMTLESRGNNSST